ANGPLLPFITTSKCCGAARQSGHSLQLQNLRGGELTDCGQTGLLLAQRVQAQHFIAVAAELLLRCSLCRRNGHSAIQVSVHQSCHSPRLR
ncbi:MAG: hypothetical protein ACI9PU_001817, partial [Ascidiaceihabitans sp.]